MYTTQYTIYLGLTDKDNHTKHYDVKNSIKHVSDIIIKEYGFEGCSINYINGCYTHLNNEIVYEDTLQIIIFARNCRLEELCNTLKREFNQESVLLTTTPMFLYNIS